MKRNSTQQATVNTATATTVAGARVSKKQKNLRSKLPRRRRTHISPLLFDFVNTKPAFSLNSNCDNVSCNTTLESNAYHAKNDVSLKPLQNGVVEFSVSENSCVESCSVVAIEAESKLLNLRPNQNDAVTSELSAIQNSPARIATEEINSGDLIGIFGSDLTCKENFSYEDYEVSSREFQSEIFSGEFCSEFEDFTDEYTPSIWLNSGSQFSEKSFNDFSPSPCYSLFKEFYKQFLKLKSDHCDYEVSSLLNDEYSDELAYWRFEDDEDEESYGRLRSRERNQSEKVKNYVEEYDFATEYGGLIVEQRLLMVNWIIEISRKKELHSETMFLGVRLLDRFLSHGFFKTRKNLQLLGISCLTLAIRIEENQPYNSVRQRSFYVESNVYSRTEVVAMEWVVQEVLKFQCLSPTIHNFLWFYLKAATANENMQRKAKYLAGLALLDHKQLQFWPSTVAAGIVILVSLSRDQHESCIRVVQAHVRTKIDDLPECIKSLEWLVKYSF